MACSVINVIKWISGGLGFEVPGNVSLWTGVELFYLLGCGAFFVVCHPMTLYGHPRQ
jgi:hypothetical protein